MASGNAGVMYLSCRTRTNGTDGRSWRTHRRTCCRSDQSVHAIHRWLYRNHRMRFLESGTIKERLVYIW